MKNKYKNIFSSLSLIIAFLFLMTITGALLWPYETIEVKRFHVTDEVPRAAKLGHLIGIEMDCYKYTQLPCRYSIGLLDGYYQVVESGISNLPLGQIKIKKNIKVSEEVPAGVYRVQFTIAYDVNPIRTITKTFITENTFTVEP